MKRREFMATAAAGIAAAAGLAQGAQAQGTAGAPGRRPNFIFIYTDDQRWDAVGVVQKEQGDKARWPWLKTPGMDRVATGGVRFRNAFVVNSLCAPSRANFLSGRYSHLNGVANNHTPFPVDSVTHATVLRQAGYKTGYFGKWHMGGQTGQRPGFDFSASFVGQGIFIDCPIEVNGVMTPSKGWVDDVTTDYALKFIRENRDNPFSVVLGLKSVHGPRTPPDRHKNDYAGMEIKPAVNAEAKAIYNVMRTGAPTPEQAVGPNQAQAQAKAGKRKGGTPGGTLEYFRTLMGADDCVGKVLDLLDELKLAEDTVVIYASDNGYYLGEHGLGDKRSAYDESLRIPLLLRYPRLVKPGTLCDAMVINIDLAPTLIDLAGAKIPETMQGRSWKPLLEGKADGWRTSYFYEYFMENNFGTPTTLAVRTEDAKLIKYPGHEEWTELFDLKADPHEMKNLARDPAAAELLKKMEAEFEKQAKAVAFRIPDYADKPGDPSAFKKAKEAKRKAGKKAGKKKAQEQ